MATTQTNALSYDVEGIHQAELVYSTPLSSGFGLHSANKFIHSIQSLPYPLELLVFLFGYAFNPVSIVPWMAVLTMTGAIPSSPKLQSKATSLYFAPLFYLATVLVTLIATEGCKFSFRATRPEGILSLEFRQSKLRRFGTLVASLKSKHSFPSGDSAQGQNLVLFWYYYICPQLKDQLDERSILLLHLFAFGVFYPGVAFARVFYHCHWIEDTLAGGLLAFILHQLVIPTVSDVVWRLVDQANAEKVD
jgi:membrane-associated phospholipid phosphatase